MSDDRPCTCHPSEAPVPCQRKYAFSECENAALRAERDALRADLTECRLDAGSLALKVRRLENDLADTKCQRERAEENAGTVYSANKNLVAERDELRVANQALTRDRDTALAHRLELERERLDLRAERDELRAKLANSERIQNDLSVFLGNALAERDALRAQTAKKDAALKGDGDGG